MTKRMQFLSFLCTVALMVGMASLGARANAQQSSQQPNAAPGQPPSAYPNQQQPGAYPGQQPGQQPPAGQATPPDTQAQPAPGNTQTFTGVVTKSGDKYVLKDDASGKTYDLDHQDMVKKYDGQKVRVKGTLDPNGSLIHIQ